MPGPPPRDMAFARYGQTVQAVKGRPKWCASLCCTAYDSRTIQLHCLLSGFPMRLHHEAKGGSQTMALHPGEEDTERSKERRAHRTQIIVAIIGAVGVVGGSAFAGGLFTGKAQAPDPSPTVTVTKTQAVSTGGSTTPPATSTSGGASPVRWSGGLLITSNGVDLSADPPTPGPGQVWWYPQGDQLQSNVIVARWDGRSTPSRADCDERLHTQALPLNYSFQDPRAGLTFCVATDLTGSPDYEAVIQVKSINTTGVETKTTVWEPSQ